MREPSALPACERFRMVAALQVDGEASALELELQAAHVRRCPQCRTFAADVEAFTTQLRAGILELPSRPTAVGRRTTARGRGAAALALGVLLTLGVHPHPSDEWTAHPPEGAPGAFGAAKVL